MKNKEEKLYTVGELAKRCGITVRTLQYYDNEGILCPEHYTEGGRRLYSMDDMLILQQILFLKSFGFSLGEIRERLLEIDSPDKIKVIFKRQKEALSEQIKKLKDIKELLTKFINETDKTGYLGADKMVMLIKMMKENNPYSFILSYFGKREMKNLVRRIDIKGNEDEGITFEWQDLFDKLIELNREGVDPKGPRGQAFAKKWWNLVQKYTAGDPEMLKTLMEMGNDIDNWPDQVSDLKLATKEFLNEALGKYLNDIGIMQEGELDYE